MHTDPKADFKEIPILKIAHGILRQAQNGLVNITSPAKDPQLTYSKFHSQHGEDRFIYNNLKTPKRGVFVDVGAGDPQRFSNTYFFEKNGWQGVCIDADPDRFELLKKKRANVEWGAIALEDGELDFNQAIVHDFSGAPWVKHSKFLLKKIVRVPCFRLDTIFVKHKIQEVDLLSIDVEGAELDVLQSFDYRKYRPKVVIVEYQTFKLGDQAERIKQFFLNTPYRLVHTTCVNLIFHLSE